MQNARSAFAILAVVCGISLPAWAEDVAFDVQESGVKSADYERPSDGSRGGVFPNNPRGNSRGPNEPRNPNHPEEPDHPEEIVPIQAQDLTPDGPFNAGAANVPVSDAVVGNDYDNAVSNPSQADSFWKPAWLSAPPSRMYFQADVMWLNRSQIADQVLVERSDNNQPLLNVSSVDLANRPIPGAEFTLGQRLDPVSAIELTYFGLNNWNASAQVAAPGNLSLAPTLAQNTNDFIFANNMSVDYRSTVNNGEANWRQTLMGTTVLAGFRYFNLHEEFNIRASGVSAFPSDYNIRTWNNLIGGQLGTGFHQEFGRLGIDLLGKGGGYVNVAQQDQVLRDFSNSFTVRDFTNQGSPISFLGELKVTATYRVTSWLSVRAGYRAMWVTGLALAPNQLDFTSTKNSGNDLHTDASLFFHGANAGLEARW